MTERIGRRTFLGGISTVLVASAGCLGSEDETGDGSGDDSMDNGGNEGGDDGMSDGGDGDAATRAAWQTTQLTNPVSGDSFQIAELDGPVVVHPFAIWCTVCSRQNGELGSLGADSDHEIVMLNIATGEGGDSVRSYAEDNGYEDTNRLAVASEEMSGSLVDEFGPSAVNPPQSPVIVVCPNGETHTLEKVAAADAIDQALADRC
jgi:hypothetical protein